MMEDLCQTLRDTGAHPIDKAVYAHMVIAAIQPFRSAHKRLGRLIQDSILFDHLLPAATIFPGERATYYDFLRNAVIGYSRNDSELKAPFFNYVAGKINVKLDTCVTHLFGEHTDNFSALDNFKHLGNSRRNGKR
jgi:Fic family protein